MDSATLNVDTLHNVMSLSDRKTVSRVMRTCQVLNHEGVRHLLDDTPCITNKKQAHSFTWFFFSGQNGARMAHRLRWSSGVAISLTGKKAGAAVGEAMTRFFLDGAPHAPSFTRLKIYEAEAVLSANPLLPAAIAMLTTLRHLTLDSAGAVSAAMLRLLRSRLVSAEIAYNLANPPRSLEDRNAIAMLHHSEDTLNTVILENPFTSPDGPCYPNVRSLTLKYMDVPTTRHLVHAFPNLAILRFSDHFESEPDNFDEDEDGLDRKREANMAEQRQHGSWDSILGYKGPLFVLYGLGITCQVHLLVVHDHEDEEISISMLRKVVADARPSHLTVRITEVRCLVEKAKAFVRLCQRFDETLSSLELNLCLSPGDWTMDMGALMECICSALSAAPSITAFKIELDWAVLESFKFPADGVVMDFDGSIVVPGVTTTAKDFLNGLDANSVADRLLSASKALKTVMVVLARTDEDVVTVKRGPPEEVFDMLEKSGF
ncbi:hypothetical protein LXA43DRAFT_1052799 [Ganoderma leucocontextum]|nr:hypothetical protein LXA43DRAFT_1052799 [Ganoderma leucocontextum]